MGKNINIIMLLILYNSLSYGWVFQPRSECDSEPFISQPGNRTAEAYKEYQKKKLR